MSKFKDNPLKTRFIEGLATESLELSDLCTRSKFNFSYFDKSQNYASGFDELENNFLCTLMEKLKSYSRFPLLHWKNQRAGSGGLKIFEIYEDFPKKSEFTRPNHVPHDIYWARFRLENFARLIGFIVPGHLSNKPSNHLNYLHDTNTFYVVFIDLQHKFYLTEKK